MTRTKEGYGSKSKIHGEKKKNEARRKGEGLRRGRREIDVVMECRCEGLVFCFCFLDVVCLFGAR